jgi:hypothetical protein
LDQVGASPGDFDTLLTTAVQMVFAESVLQYEFSTENDAQKFSAGLRRDMKRRLKMFKEYESILAKKMGIVPGRPTARPCGAGADLGYRPDGYTEPARHEAALMILSRYCA